MKKTSSKLVFYLMTGIYIITLAGSFIYNYLNGNQQAFYMGIVACLTPWLFPALMHNLKIKMTDEVKILNVVFIYFASLIGSCLGGYHVAYFDKIVHFFSGILASIFAVFIFTLIKKQTHISNKQDYIIFLIFIVAVNLSIAVIWEFYEYGMLIFFNNDCINHYSTGVHDSLTDMICAFLGGLIVLGYVISYYRKDKQNWVINMVQRFYNKNIETFSKL